MLAFVTAAGRGEADRLMAWLAGRLREDGLRLAGALQRNVERPGTEICDMELCLVGRPTVWRISQDLGPGAQGCRLDPEGLEQAAGEVAAMLATRPADLLIVNRFGKQEIDGRGFRPVIADALLRDIPVLTTVNAKNLPAFLAFAEGLAEPLPDQPEALLHWCRSRIAPPEPTRASA